ncbi:MAG TPA: fumarylacetoacetate hydrolase [Chloroflexi bacterium]|nr:fumarylacetoacetate hydrolase [Chloroflexota bacterium]
MQLTRHQTPMGPRWAADKHWLAETFDLGSLLEIPHSEIGAFIDGQKTAEPAPGDLLAPIEAYQEVWASGVTYLRSREARQSESNTGDVYDRVYAAQRPELFFKAIGWRVMGPHQPLRIRSDSHWNVPEPELTLVINRHGEIIGYTAGNDMSSRSIEGENPLYLPQAKIYDASCSLGPAIHLLDISEMSDLPIEIAIDRAGQPIFQGKTSTANMNRKPEELVAYLFRELSFPQGAFLLTGTGIVPPDQFTLAPGDSVTIMVGDLTLVNEIG